MSEKQITTGSTNGCRLRLRFVWGVDRYRQTIKLANDADAGESERDLLSSVEGNPTDRWPASPPLQDLNFHDTPGGLATALAVGMAGKSHWSVSWEASQNEATLVCDVACRVKQRPDPLVSTWHVDGAFERGGTLLLDDDRTIDVAPSVRLRIESGANGEFSVAPERTGRGLVLAARPTEGELPRTIRWRYRITIV